MPQGIKRFTRLVTLPVPLIFLALIAGCCPDAKDNAQPARTETAGSFPTPQIAYAPRHYMCYHTDAPVVIDGRLSDPAWQAVSWTDPFVDIEGNLKAAPRFQTRAKMLWDSTHLYIAAELAEPDVWGTLTERDAVIYHDNDFEVFIDPDGDTHEYYELEVNALNTVWDLFLVKPYRDGGPALNAWDIQGLKTAVAVSGTINTPGDRDSGWGVEIALPWTVLGECAHRATPPSDGDQWRLNFSRVEWRTEVKNGKYLKLLDSATGKALPEDNWVWSPQGLIAMHYPEMWGIVQFVTDTAGSKAVEYLPDPAEPARWALFKLYYAEQDFWQRHGTFTADILQLGIDTLKAGSFSWPPKLKATANLFEAVSIDRDEKTTLSIRQDGRLRRKSR